MRNYYALRVAIGLALIGLATSTRSANADTHAQGDILAQGRCFQRAAKGMV